jgi:hypothetical protein
MQRNKPGLLRMQGQRIFLKTLCQHRQDSLRIFLPFKAQHCVIGIPDHERCAFEPWFDIPFKPPIQYLVQINVRQ